MTGRLRFGYAAIAVLTVAAYSNSFSAGFALDNDALILRDPRIRELTPGNLTLIRDHSYFWPNGEAGIYRPFTTLSYLFNYAVLGNGADPSGYHWVNLLLHLLNVGLVLALARRVLGDDTKALAAAALWAVHPVATEAVTNIIGRSDLLAGAGVLTGLLFYLRSAEGTGFARNAALAGIGLATAMGAFSKESAVVLPAVILLYESVFGRRWKAALAGCAATLPGILAMLAARTAVLAASAPAEFPFVDNPIVGAGFMQGRLTALEVLARYVEVAVFPWRLSADYSFGQIPLAAGFSWHWLVWLGIAGAAIACRRNRAVVFFGALAFVCAAPSSNLLIPTGTIMAERLLYLPLAGLVGAACAFVRPNRVVFAGVAAAALVFAGRTWVRNLDWKDDLTMAEAGVRTSPESFKVHRLLAASLYKADPARALAEADKAVAILAPLPNGRNLAEPWSLASTLHLRQGDYEGAIRLALRSAAIEDLRPTHSVAAAPAYRVLTAGYLHTSKPEKALETALRAKALNPGDPEVHGDLADVYIALSRPEEAAVALAEGMFTTSDMGLRRDLVALYSKTETCAVRPGPNGPALNPDCPAVRRDLCRAASLANRKDLGRQIHCPE